MRPTSHHPILTTQGTLPKDFEEAASSNKFDVVAFIGHNGLMDFNLDVPNKPAGNDTEVVVLCCLSEKYFGKRLRDLGCTPILMTQQLMYPGSFLLHAALEKWRTGGTHADIRAAAATAYAKNQKISVRAAAGVFAPPAVGTPRKASDATRHSERIPAGLRDSSGSFSPGPSARDGSNPSVLRWRNRSRSPF